MEISLDELARLMTLAAAEGIRVAPTAGDHTDSGVAYSVMKAEGYL